MTVRQVLLRKVRFRTSGPIVHSTLTGSFSSVRPLSDCVHGNCPLRAWGCRSTGWVGARARAIHGRRGDDVEAAGLRECGVGGQDVAFLRGAGVTEQADADGEDRPDGQETPLCDRERRGARSDERGGGVDEREDLADQGERLGCRSRSASEKQPSFTWGLDL